MSLWVRIAGFEAHPIRFHPAIARRSQSGFGQQGLGTNARLVGWVPTGQIGANNADGGGSVREWHRVSAPLLDRVPIMMLLKLEEGATRERDAGWRGQFLSHLEGT